MKIQKYLKRFVQIFVILGLIVISAVAIWILNETKPEAAQKETVTKKALVEAIKVKYESITIDVPSQGIVQPKKRTQLASELSGKVIWISDKFTTGGRFETTEEILRIDPTTYDSAVIQAQSSLVDAEVALTNEKARAAQAKRDWARLGRGRPSTLTLREPQIRSAESRITAATAALEKAILDQQKTTIRAPFKATVARKSTEIGNYLAPGSPIGEFFQTEPLELRMPLPIDELRFLNTDQNGSITGDMLLSTKLGNQVVEWQANIDRTEGQIDQQSRSIYLISDIIPGKLGSNPIKLQPGLFLNASIRGKTFDRIAKVPAAAFLDLNRVVLVNKNDELEFRDVSVLRRAGDFVYVDQGLNENERLCLTELSTMIEGTKVKVRELVPPDQAKIERDPR